MKNVKQAIIVRKDLKLHKSKLAGFASQASMKFLIDNNEAARGDELIVKLSQEEVQWIEESFPKSILGVDSHDALVDVIFRAELLGLNTYSVFEEKSSKPDENAQLVCAALGPDDEDLINQITGHLKSI
jgi:peptidyl-tRNA hydrolase